jgi:peptide-methionine (S)-S-oxide reductase
MKVYFSIILFCVSLAINVASTHAQATNKALKTSGGTLEQATFGMGCFWCTEAVFQKLKGVSNVASGYSGGSKKNPTYEQVTDGNTGHAEVITLSYDPKVVSYAQLLEIFWKLHDPTTLNRQGADEGTQYRSVILYHNKNQQAEALKYKTLLTQKKVFGMPIVTQIVPFKAFYKAESYHQNYFKSNGNKPYCRMVIQPKVDKLEEVFKNRLK